jgi:hypothetical protein
MPSVSRLNNHMTSGKSMPPTRNVCSAAVRYPGCAMWTSSPAPCSARRFSPHGTFSEVPPAQVQEDFRQRFCRWGLPLRFRVDNGNPWGNWNDLPTALSLWLFGLGVEVLWNDPGHPEQNPKVERSQGTGRRWAEPHRCRDVAELQEHFDEVDVIQRERYPAVGGQSRQEAFPELAQVRRRYTRSWERRQWDLLRALEHLASYAAVRRVSGSGHVSVYASNYYVGTAYCGQNVYVELDPSAQEWVISDPEGRQLRRHKAQQVTREGILKLRWTKKQ